jgi:hypothetical protein
MKGHSCYCVFDPDGKPLWYTVRPSRADALTVYETATGRKWARCLAIDYTVRKLKLTEVK